MRRTLPYGYGRWTNLDEKIIIEAEWKNGRKHGISIETICEYSQILETKKGKIHGKCIQKYNDGSSYER